MSNDSVLKKEFKQNDVQRLRNLVQGKHGDRTTMGTGYTKAKEFHDEGAAKIAANAEEKGGLSLLTWHHFKVKAPY
jgi:hypothetical protein